MGLYYNGRKVRNLYFNGKCITRLALGKEMTRLVEGDDFVRAEYIEGDGMAHIDIPVNIYRDTVNTLLIPKVDYSVVAYNGMKNIGNNNVAEFRVLIGGEQEFSVRHGVRINGTATAVIKGFNNNYIDKIFEISTYRNGSNYCGTINGKTYNIANGDIQSADTDITVSIILSKFKLGYFRIPTKFSLTPCRLLRPIPAALDANGIARNAGECGMFDAVSGKFYGNVASSGTFTVEPSLVEGVDYEVHRWLKTGSGTPYIQVDDTCNTDANAYIETTYKCNYSNGGFDMVVGFSVNQNNNIGIRIFNTANGTFVDYHKTENGVLSSYRVFKSQSSINAERYIKATLNNLIVDTTEYPTINWGSGFDSVNYPNTRLLTNSVNNDVRFKRTKIRVNFKEFDLVPVRLLRPLPAYLDANGKARAQYECGMVDLNTGTFYGNMNTSGKFTVSDN